MMERYPGKILLFGEYLVLDNHMGLASPLSSTYCALTDEINPANTLPQNLSISDIMKDWIAYCTDHDLSYINQADWAKDVDQTLSLHSNIPIGYGLGSSGALTACIYARYGEKTNDQNETRKRLAQMESFFHGKSSGIDPWVSFSKQSWLFQGKTLHAVNEDKIAAFTDDCVLIDSGIARNTKSLVARFQMERKQMKGWDEMVEVSNALAQSFTANPTSPINIQESLHRLSVLQRRNMSWLIPETIQGLWDEVLATGNAMKLCGAGGGGYFLLHDPVRQYDDLIAKHNLTARKL